MRLIDADAVELGFDELCRSPYFKHDVNVKHGAETLMDVCVRTDSHMPNTIDPETLPIVRQLREKVKNLNIVIENLSQVLKIAYEQRDNFKEELARVTAERDAAVSDLENIMAYNSDTCQSCKNNQCYVRGGTKPCLPKWRGPQKEARP